MRKKTWVDKECPICWEMFYVRPSYVNKAKCCSKKCLNIFQLKRIKFICKYCWCEYERRPSELKIHWSSYCSDDCKHKSFTPFFWEDNYQWKWDNITYRTIHRWVENNKWKAIVCSKCWKTKEEWMIHWSNIDHKYRRNLDDYVSLCVKCHKAYDKTIKQNTTEIKKEDIVQESLDSNE